MHSIRVLLIAEDSRLASRLKRWLGAEGISLDRATDVGRAKRMVQSAHFDTILLTSPEHRSAWRTGTKGSIGGKIPAMVLAKSLHLNGAANGSGHDKSPGVIAALSTLTRRLALLAPATRNGANASLQCAGIVMNTVSREVFRNGTRINLTSREFALLEFFMRNQCRVLTRSVISEKIWHYDFDTGTNVIDVYVNHLRAKIDAGFEQKVIHTVRGVGYSFGERKALPGAGR